MGSKKKPLGNPRPPESKPNPILKLNLTLPMTPHGGLFSGGIFSWHQIDEINRNRFSDKNYSHWWRRSLLIYLTMYLIFLFLLFKHSISILGTIFLIYGFFKKVLKNSTKMNSKWFLSTIVAYRYHTSVFWFSPQRK